MAHGQNKTYEVYIYEDSYSTKVKLVKTFRKYEQAKKFLHDYLRENTEVSRAYIESKDNYRNDKRNQWN